MTRRWPLIPTLLVTAAVACMLALGIWQLGRSAEKERLVEGFRAAAGKPEIAYPTVAPVPDSAMFRRSSAVCVRVVGWQVEAGRAADGQPGYRHIAQCSTGAEGPGLLADMGVSSDPAAKTAWTGGVVRGVITTEPDHNSLAARLAGRAVPLRPMLVADAAAPGFKLSARPSPDEVPNNHFSYAVQWFLFALAAAVIYILALRKRWAAEGAK
jgi:surfeit locus 1 family protein